MLDFGEVEEKLNVLVVDDQPEIQRIFKGYLTPEARVTAVGTTREAFTAMDESIDVIVLDRNMAGTSGDEFLTRLRQEDAETPVAMVTAVFPDFDIAAQEFDAYLLKPVGRRELRNTVAAVKNRHDAGEPIREYFATLSKVVALESEIQRGLLAENRVYEELLSRLDDLEGDVRDALASKGTADVRALTADFSTDGDPRIDAVLPA